MFVCQLLWTCGDQWLRLKLWAEGVEVKIGSHMKWLSWVTLAQCMLLVCHEHVSCAKQWLFRAMQRERLRMEAVYGQRSSTKSIATTWHVMALGETSCVC